MAKTLPVKHNTSFLDLPAEIRNKIYGYYFWPQKASTFKDVGDMPGLFHHCTNLYLANKQILLESRSFFLERFLFCIWFRFNDMKPLLRLTQLVPRKDWVNIHANLELENNDYSDYEFSIRRMLQLVAEELGYADIGDVEDEDPCYEKEYDREREEFIHTVEVWRDEERILKMWWDLYMDPVSALEYVKMEGCLGKLKCLGELVTC